jgi:hypothetical protein
LTGRANSKCKIQNAKLIKEAELTIGEKVIGFRVSVTVGRRMPQESALQAVSREQRTRVLSSWRCGQVL